MNEDLPSREKLIKAKTTEFCNDRNNNNNNDVACQNNNNNLNHWEAQPEKQVQDKCKTIRSGISVIKLKNGSEFIEVDRFGKGGTCLSPLMINLCTFIYSLVPTGSIISGIILIWLLFTSYWFITMAYIAYLLISVNARDRGGQRIESNFQSQFWKYIAAYFPVKLRYSTNFKLDPSENYLVNYSPHGISAFGSVVAFATNGLDFTSLFPGIKPRFMVHEMVFLTPFMREFFAYRGDCSVASKSIDFMLNPAKAGTGNLLTLVAGGLQEADLSHQQNLKIFVMKRKGFIKKAITNGANIIPTIAFGENSVFTKVDPKPKTLLYSLDKLAYKYLGFKHPLYYGNGTMPYKRPVTVVMGDPILVEKNLNPTQEEIDFLHKRYVTDLEQIYETHADLRLDFDTKLEIV